MELKKSVDRFNNKAYTKEKKHYAWQIRETKNGNLVLYVIPKDEAGKFIYDKQLFLGKLFDKQINVFEMNFILDEDRCELLPLLDKPEKKNKESDIDIPF